MAAIRQDGDAAAALGPGEEAARCRPGAFRCPRGRAEFAGGDAEVPRKSK